jgi:signal transduction histidine kinase
MMFRTIFHKMITIFIVVLLLCFAFSAIFFNISVSRYVVDQRTEVLDVYGERILSALEILLDNRMDPTTSFIFRNLLEAVATNTSSIVWIADDRGYLLAYSSVPEAFVNKLQYSNGFFQLTNPKQYAFQETPSIRNEIGTFYGLFDETGMQWLTVKIPFSYSDIIIDGNPLRGNVIMHTPVPEIQKTGATILNLFLPAVFLSFLLSFILMYILSKRITSPLKQMTLAARKIASGDWQSRLSFSGNDEVAVLAESFNHMIVTLDNLEKMRRDFVASISHELRTPMTSINGFIEGILDGTIPEDKQKDYLNIVKEEVKRLQRLVSDMLDIARMEAGETKVNITDFDICETVRLSVIHLQQIIEEKNINFRASFEQEIMKVRGDRDAIQRVIINLLHNAAKFTPENGDISVSIREVKGKAEIKVSDSGVGISKEDLPYIFDRFHKADKSRGRDKTSVGLGLYIVKNILKAHQEEIHVESEPGCGTAFTFSLPFADD